MANIEPKRFYSLAEVVEHGFLEGVVPKTDVRGIRQLLETKKLRHLAIGKGVARRYFIKGENIITFIAKMEAGDIFF